jgi:hypothetical protein
MLDRFEIIGHDSPRPNAEHIIFCAPASHLTREEVAGELQGMFG